jgi:FKBP-type peptidyl-prolyl cis-trans isomerase FklB
MKKLGTAAMLILAIFAFTTCNSTSSFKSTKPKNNNDTASYMIGISVGHSLKAQNVPDVNVSLIAKGIEEVLNNDSSVTAQEAQVFLNAYFTQIREREADKNKEEGLAWLEENKNNPGVIETESGLQYKVIEEGTGKSPAITDRVKCHYEGRLIDGTVFDSSYDHGQPVEFGLKGVIRGWTEGLQLMKEGGKYELYIPSDLAYGPRGGGQVIGPNATLIFTIELLEVIPAEQ